MPLQKRFDIDGALEKAMTAFWARGFEATSMQDLVECMGVNRGSLYATFGDKRSLFLAALRRYDQKMRQQLLSDLEAKSDPREAIRKVFEAFATQTSDGRPSKGCFVTNSTLELAAHDREVREIVAEAQGQMEAFFARMIEKGKARGEIASRVKTDEVARGLLASLQGMIVLTRSRPDKALFRAIIDDAMRRLE